MAHSSEATALASLTLTLHLMKTLHAKGVFSNEDYQAVLASALQDISQNDRAAEVTAVIREIAGV